MCHKHYVTQARTTKLGSWCSWPVCKVKQLPVQFTCFLRGWGEVRWSIGGGRFSLKEICGMCGSCGSLRGGS